MSSRRPAGDLARKADLLTAMVNALPVVAYAFDADGVVLLAEGQGLAEMDSAPGLSVGRSVFDLFAGETDALAHVRRALSGERHEADVRLRRNGRLYHVWYTPAVDARGRLTGVSGLSLDITDQERSERELREATRWLQNVLDKLPVSVYRVDTGGILTFARGSFLTERSHTCVGKPLADCYAHLPELLSAVDEAMAGRDQAFSYSDWGRHFEFLVNGMRDERGPLGVIGIVIEVTDQRRAAAAVAENEQKSKLLASVSHELRTPLNTILGYAQLMQQHDAGELDERHRRYLHHIREGGEHMVQVVNQLFDLSRILAGNLVLSAQAIDPAALVAETVERMAPIAQQLGVRLAAGRQTRRPVLADRFRLTQILTNLVANALKFTPGSGAVRVTSSVRAGAVVFGVADTGIGIPAEDRERVFEEFIQLASGIDGRERGIGLGLALSRRLARAMGGDLTVGGRTGKGTTFYLTLRPA